MIVIVSGEDNDYLDIMIRLAQYQILICFVDLDFIKMPC